MRVITVLLVMISCFSSVYGQKNLKNEKGYPYVDESLFPYVKEYLFDMIDKGISVDNFFKLDSVLLVDTSTQICLSDHAEGCCSVVEKKVKIRTPSPKSDGDSNLNTFLKLAVYHELGHCVLRLTHNPYTFSIMNAGHRKLDRYEILWDRLREEYISYYFFCEKVKSYK